MDILSIIVIAVGLSMDCFAVAIAAAASNKKFTFRHAVVMALFFGGFQGGMALIGWFFGISISDIIGSFDHFIAFILLSIIGARMIHESFELDEVAIDASPVELWPLIVLSFATSIDALAVGATFGVLGQLIFIPSAIIAAVCFAITLAGGAIGEKVGHLFENKIEVLGGVVLILIGLKILLEHIF